jgi:hypothetical protein
MALIGAAASAPRAAHTRSGRPEGRPLLTAIPDRGPGNASYAPQSPVSPSRSKVSPVEVKLPGAPPEPGTNSRISANSTP